MQYCRRFGESMKENVKKLSNWSAHNFTNHRSWYPLPENTMLFHDIPQLSKLPAVKMSSKDQQVLIELSNVYVWLIRQRTGRQETTMAKVGTLPSFCYNNTQADAQVPLPQTMKSSTEKNQWTRKQKMTMVNMQKWRMKLPSRCRLEMKILLVK